MATVYLAHDLRHDRDVAIKVLHPELAAVLGAERFLAEIKTTAKLQHPHILPLLDSGEVDGLLFYAMPVVEGESLRARLERETQLPIDDAVRITSEVLSALDYAHRHGVVHRDIKPENILLHDNQALVVDFGIALAVSAAGGARLTQTGLSLGTPQYMSPEQATGEKSVDARSDVYSVGCVLYEMLAGAAPFTGPTAQAIVAKVITTEAVSVTAQRKTVAPHVAEAVRIALQKLPADRFASAAEFGAALEGEGWATGAAVARRRAHEGAPAAGRTRASSWNSLTRAFAAVSLLLAAGLVTSIVLPPGRSSGDARVTRVSLRFPANQRPRTILAGLPMLALHPGGGGLVFAGPGSGTRTQLWLRRWDQMEATRLDGTADGSSPVFSPNGDSLALLVLPHGVKIVPLAGGVPKIVLDSGIVDVAGNGGGLDWAKDGRLYASSFQGLIRISPRDGSREDVSHLDAKRGDYFHVLPAVLPSGRGALVTVAPKNPTPGTLSIGVADFATGTVDVVLQGIRARYARSGHIVYAEESGALWAVPFDEKRLRVTGKRLLLGDTVAVGSLADGADFALSDDGNLVYLKRGARTSRVVWVDRAGDERDVAPDLSGSGVDSPALSPDARRLAISMQEGGMQAVWVKPLGGGPKTRLTFDGNSNTRSVWNPDGQTVTFLSDRVGGRGAIFSRRADGGGEVTQAKTFDQRDVWGAAWSPEGRWLIYRTNNQAAGNADIMGIRPGVDTVPRRLIATDAEEMGPAVSPDGRWIAYSSNESGRREVYVRPFPETERAKYQVSTNGGAEAVWSRNGKELFYRDATDSLVAVPLTPGSTFQRGVAKALFSVARYASTPFHRQYDVTPDGQRFVMIRSEAIEEDQVVVVFNFVEELTRRFRK